MITFSEFMTLLSLIPEIISLVNYLKNKLGDDNWIAFVKDLSVLTQSLSKAQTKEETDAASLELQKLLGRL